MNFILTEGKPRNVAYYARTRVKNLLEQGLKDSTVFCLGENKQNIVTNIKRYVESMIEELRERNFNVNVKAHSTLHKFYTYQYSERLGSMPPTQAVESTRNYDVIKITIGAGHDGIPALFASFYPVDSLNVDCGYVQPDTTIRIPLVYGNNSVFRCRGDNKAAVTMFGISIPTLDEVRTHLSRIVQVPVPLQAQSQAVDDDSVPMMTTPIVETDDDSMPENITHAATVVDSIRQQSKNERQHYA